MNTEKDRLITIIDEISESDLTKVLEFVESIKDEEMNKDYKDITAASAVSLNFWDNDITYLFHK
jgi:hypothetical protein